MNNSSISLNQTHCISFNCGKRVFYITTQVCNYFHLKLKKVKCIQEIIALVSCLAFFKKEMYWVTFVGYHQGADADFQNVPRQEEGSCMCTDVGVDG